uniref:Peptidase C-terminal archaeal/bacterial domain-containing protein n=1 Tax=Magnetococcus massalia (strain MO-1) TaxID=451514 RepID=A0A1S7LGZ4_MAGMO|nr:protein of unknown function [Candidatus Magnetococcus massalia]
MPAFNAFNYDFTLPLYNSFNPWAGFSSFSSNFQTPSWGGYSWQSSSSSAVTLSSSSDEADSRPLQDALDDDTTSSNNSRSTATELGSITSDGEWQGLEITSNDRDWYHFSLDQAGAAGDQVSIQFEHALGDLDMRLHNSSGRRIDFSNSVEDQESISLEGLASGDYYLQVYGYWGDSNPDYSLSFDITSSEEVVDEESDNSDATSEETTPLLDDDATVNNDSRSQATELGGITEDSQWQGLSITEDDRDWYSFSLESEGVAGDQVSIAFSHALGDLDMRLHDSSGRRLDLSNSVDDQETISLEGLGSGDYYLQVYGYWGDSNPEYSLTFDLASSTEPADEAGGGDTLESGDLYEDNNSMESATDLGVITESKSISNLSITDEDQDWLRFELSESGDHADLITIDFEHDQGDLDMRLLDADGELLGLSNSVEDYEALSLDGLDAGLYYLEVYGYHGVANPQYDLNIIWGDDLLDPEADDLLDDTFDDDFEEDDELEEDFEEEDAEEDDVLEDEYEDDAEADDVFEDDTLEDDAEADDAFEDEYEEDSTAEDDSGEVSGDTVSSWQNPVLLGALATAVPLDGLAIESDSSDWFQFTLDQTGLLGDAIGITFDHDQGDLDIGLYDASGQYLDLSAGIENSESIDLQGLTAGNYLLEVYGYQGVANPEYEFSIEVAEIAEDESSAEESGDEPGDETVDDTPEDEGESEVADSTDDTSDETDPSDDTESDASSEEEAVESSSLDAWTLMVYIDADNNLEAMGIDDINEMERVDLGDDINVVVQIDRIPGYDTSNGNWTDTRRGDITQDQSSSLIGSELESIGEQNMGDPDTLTDFINWSVENNPAQNYGLIIWDHGAGIDGMAWDDSTPNHDYLSLSELTKGLQNSDVEQFDLIGFDLCLQGMAEQSHELADLADVMVASEDLEPGDGWDYTGFLNSLAADSSMDAASLGGAIVDSYGAFYGDQTLSAIDLSGQDNLVSSINSFYSAVADNATNSDWQVMAQARDNATNYHYDAYRDLGGFMDGVANGTAGEISQTAQAVSSALSAMVIDQVDVSGASGLSIYLPDPDESVRDDYRDENFQFVADSNWDDFLQLFVTQADGFSFA